MAAKRLAAVQGFIDSVRGIYAVTTSDDERFRRVRPLLADLLADRDLQERSRSWPCGNDPANERYVNLLFYEDADYGFVLNALVKNPGETTPVHDHAHSWTLYGVLQGGERVVRYRRLDDGGNADTATLEKLDDHAVAPGYIDFVPPYEIHAEFNGDARTVGVIFRSHKVGTFLQNWYDPATGNVRQHLGPVQVPYELA
jgi:predicted metal-dependent enzyme (double-stranded beta helix superfamily)